MVAVYYLVHCDTSLQNMTDTATKCDSYFISKCGKVLLQNTSGFLIENATVLLQDVTLITKCNEFTKIRQFYKM